MCSSLSSPQDNFDKTNTPENQIVYDDLSRRDVRALIFHLLYAVEAFDYQEPLQTIVDNFNHGFNLAIPVDSELVNTVAAIIQDRELLDTLYEPFLANWRIERVSVCTKLILWFGIWELKNAQIDTRIIINEAIELAKCFAEEGSHRFINGILDAIAKQKVEQQEKI